MKQIFENLPINKAITFGKTTIYKQYEQEPRNSIVVLTTPLKIISVTYDDEGFAISTRTSIYQRVAPNYQLVKTQEYESFPTNDKRFPAKVRAVEETIESHLRLIISEINLIVASSSEPISLD